MHNEFTQLTEFAKSLVLFFLLYFTSFTGRYLPCETKFLSLVAIGTAIHTHHVDSLRGLSGIGNYLVCHD